VIEFKAGKSLSLPDLPSKQFVRFGQFELDVCNRQLWKRGSKIRLQEQPLAVLLGLLENPGELLTREKLSQILWPSQTFVDVDHGLNNAVKRLRETLCDSAEKPLFIETIPRRGYRFIAPVHVESAAPETPTLTPNVPLTVELPTPNPLAVKWRLLNRRLVAIGAAFIIISILIGWVAAWLGRAKVKTVIQILPVTTYPGDENQPSLSPDGRQVAFTWTGEKGDNRDIYVTTVGEHHPIRLTSDPAEDAYPAWSPDGKHIAFIRRSAGTRADILLMPAIGGPERKLREVRLGAWIAGRMLAWSPDGKWLCFTNEVGTSANHVLFLLSPDTGEVRRILPAQENGEGDSSPAFSPDSRWLAFSRSLYPNNGQLLLLHLSPGLMYEGKPQPVGEAGINPKTPVWLPDGKRFLFVDRNRIMEAAIGEAAHPIYVSGSAFGELSIARTVPRIVASSQSKDAEILILSLAGKGLAAAGNAEPFVPSTAGQSHPRFSPDGRTLAFVSKRSGSSEIWLANFDGTNPRQLTHLSAYISGYPDWSADGKLIVFHARLPNEPQIYVVRVEDGLVRQITHDHPGFTAPTWSNDGQTIYASAFWNGETRLYSVSAAGSAPRLLWEASYIKEVQSRGLLVYEKEDKPGIYARSLHGDPMLNPERLLVADFQPPWGGLYPTEDGIYYSGSGASGRPRAIRFYSFASGRSMDVAPITVDLNLGLSVAPDRSRLAYTTRAPGNEDLVELEIK
jgi:Tol biopolymer transport system component/DNA-binding winged helix-turn-helix (wHTH) protein